MQLYGPFPSLTYTLSQMGKPVRCLVKTDKTISFCFKKISVMWGLHIGSREKVKKNFEVIQVTDYLNLH